VFAILLSNNQYPYEFPYIKIKKEPGITLKIAYFNIKPEHANSFALKK
jgi:hypothetical protein